MTVFWQFGSTNILLWNAWNMDCIFRYVPYNITLLTICFPNFDKNHFKSRKFKLFVLHSLFSRKIYIILSFCLRNSLIFKELLINLSSFCMSEPPPVASPCFFEGALDKHVIFHTQTTLWVAQWKGESQRKKLLRKTWKIFLCVW